MVQQILTRITERTGHRIAECAPRRAWGLLLFPTALVVAAYLLWSARLLLRPISPYPDAYAVYLRSEVSGLQQQLRQTELTLLAVQVRQRKIELDLLEASYTRQGRPPALPPVTRPTWKAALKP